MTKARITILGSGNMGKSLIKGLIKQGYPAGNITAVDREQSVLDQLHTELHIVATTDLQAAARQAEVILLAVKPQVLQSVCATLKPVINKQLIISVAAGIRCQTLSNWLIPSCAIIRAMPNTPALVGKGATALYANAHVTAQQLELAETILRSVGICVTVQDESLMDTITALSGSGPAYFFKIMYALQQGAEKAGLTAEMAKLLTIQTALGAATMALQSDDDLLSLQKNVTSPGGTTEKAISVLESHKLDSILQAALDAAIARSKELATLMGE